MTAEIFNQFVELDEVIMTDMNYTADDFAKENGFVDSESEQKYYAQQKEIQLLELVRLKKLRIVSPARKRKLRKRGISVRWSGILNSYIWQPNW